jgi:hypothetical protein
MKRLIPALVICFLVSCKGGKSYERRMDKVLGGDVFRGHDLGDSYTNVMKSENSEYLQFPDSNILKYKYHVTDSEEYHWAYVFDKDKVIQIQFDAYLGEPVDGSIYCKKAIKKFEKNWGKPSEKNGIISWQKEGKNLDLIDESPIVSMGKVKILFYYTGDSTIQNYIPAL